MKLLGKIMVTSAGASMWVLAALTMPTSVVVSLFLMGAVGMWLEGPFDTSRG